MASVTDDVRVWLVERGYTNRDLIILQYATPDGDRRYRRERSPQALDRTTVAAAKEVSLSNLEPVEETDVRERDAAEATRMAAEHDPDDTVSSSTPSRPSVLEGLTTDVLLTVDDRET